MDDVFDFLLRKVLPLVFLLSFFGLGRGGKKSANKKKPEVVPGDRRPPPRRPEPATGYDPFEEVRTVLEPVRAPAPPPVVVVPPPPRPKIRRETAPPRQPGGTRASNDPSLESERQNRQAYEIDANAAYALSDSETAQRANRTDQGAYVIGARQQQLPRADELVKRRFLDREALRRAVLMKEILGLPVALRDEERRYF